MDASGSVFPDERYFEALADDDGRLGATPVADLDRGVPGCPEWDVESLIAHVGGVQRWATGLLVADPPENFGPKGFKLTERGPAVIPAFNEAAEAAVLELRRRPLDALVIAWGQERTRRFWLRRLAHETSVHRADADEAAGRPMVIAPDLAADGIDEYFAEFFPLLGPNPLELAADAAPRTAHVHCTDVDGEWFLRFSPDGVSVEREHANGEVAARGDASDLLLALWGRRQPGRPGLEVIGDAGLLEQMLAASNRF
jgi:uncharacterized protein (TIGR03083 family)